MSVFFKNITSKELTVTSWKLEIRFSSQRIRTILYYSFNDFIGTKSKFRPRFITDIMFEIIFAFYILKNWPSMFIMFDAIVLLRIGRTFNSAHLLFIYRSYIVWGVARLRRAVCFVNIWKIIPNIIQVTVYLGVYMKIKRSPSCAGL